jgi:protein SCO1/2
MSATRRARRTTEVVLAALLIIGLGLPFGLGVARASTHVSAPNFTLIDQFGRRFSLADHVDRPLVLFFGYSHCGDVCPLTLTKLQHAKASLGASASSLQVVFVTVDPKRDTPAVLRRYMRLFDPAFIALTGSDEALAHVYAAYHVTRHVLAPRGPVQDYDVEHSSYVFFIGRGGRLRGFGDWADSQQIVTQSVADLVAASPPVARDQNVAARVRPR